ncbi:MAG: ADP-ribosyl-[dinitrogen reductase] glycohydrolase [Anaerolineales bacterium]|nr:ADP-ribosyl-[dinitrogen reductase] glycohydrolase [Anaerolineales bacterium]
MTDIDRVKDRVIGSIVGLAVGDALGAPVEGWRAKQISQRFGTLSHYADAGRLPGAYTDDAQQALCILDVLLEHGRFDPEALAGKFVELAQPVEGVRERYFGAFRGTGPGFRDSVRALQRGASWRESGTLSAGNGTAMRVGPLGAFFHGGRFVDFRSAVFRSAWITHTDPRALSGALMIAYSVIHAINHGDDFHPEDYLHELYDVVRDAEKAIQRQYWDPNLGVEREACRHMSGAIERIRGWLKRDTKEAIGAISRYAQRRTTMRTHALSAFVLGSGIVSVYMFAKHFEDLENALAVAVNLGGDTDTIGAMVGTLAGALHGYSAIPARWREGLRNHDAIYARAEALAEGGGMPADVPSLREIEVSLTQKEATR